MSALSVSSLRCHAVTLPILFRASEHTSCTRLLVVVEEEDGDDDAPMLTAGSTCTNIDLGSCARAQVFRPTMTIIRIPAAYNAATLSVDFRSVMR